MAFFSPEVIMAIVFGAPSFIVAVVGLWFAYRVAYSLRQRSHDLEASMPVQNPRLTPAGISSGGFDNIVAIPNITHLRHAWSEPYMHRRLQVPPLMLLAQSLPRQA